MKLKIGMVGCGAIGKHHFEGIHVSRYAELSGVCDNDIEKCKQFAADTGIQKCYNSYEDMLSDNSIEAVLIATPNYFHMMQTVAAAKAGKHVLCEKPMAIDVNEARKMVVACDKAGVILMVAHHLRYKACNIKAAEMVMRGDIGRVFSARARWSFNIKENEFDKVWRGNKQLSGGGQIMNVNSHCVDLLIYLFGTPVKVSAFIQKRIEAETEDASMIMIEFADGVLAISQGSYSEETAPNNLEIFGSNFSLIVEGALSTDKYGTLKRLPSGDSEKEQFEESPYTAEIDHFAKAVREKFEPVSSGRKTIDTMKVITAAYQSAETGKHINLRNQ